MVSRNDWLKMIRDCRGNPVQLTIVRDKQQQTLTMTAGTAKKKS
jgi:C-terminal processing protease CtpA/Prc